MKTTIATHLANLHPNHPKLPEAVAALLADFRTHRTHLPDDAPLSQSDAVLITYADQLFSPDATPLRTLHQFLSTKPATFPAQLSPTIHLLPFYPSSSDDGFSVMDYTAVDPANGTRDDIAALGQDFGLMFDAVFNHASVQGPGSKNSRPGNPAGKTRSSPSKAIPTYAMASVRVRIRC